MSKHIKWPDSGIIRLNEQDVQLAEHYIGACPAPGTKVFDRTAGKDEEIGTVTELHVDPKDPTKVMGLMSIKPNPELVAKLMGQPQSSYSYSYDPDWPEVTFIVENKPEPAAVVRKPTTRILSGDQLLDLDDVETYRIAGRMPGLATMVNNLRASKIRLDAELKAVDADLRVARLKANKHKKQARARTGRRS